jgi:hypothetical protein
VNILAEIHIKFKTITTPLPLHPSHNEVFEYLEKSSRFRSAKEAEINEKKAKDRGEVLPTEERFDSNCITPGTPFMTRQIIHLLENHKCCISYDKKVWQMKTALLI